mgnify:CR=1
MRVLITGSEGYIGAVLREVLAERGHEMTGLDTGYFADCNFGAPPTPLPLIRRDLRQVTADDLHGFDAVVHLAALSNDPLGNIAADLTADINTRGSIRLAEAAKEAGVARFVFASSCSLYGQGETAGLTEEAPANPQTPYARSKVDFEAALHALAGDGFSPTSLRNATAFGVSPRLRFDIVVNNLCGWAWCAQQIRMTSDGAPWRPLVHVRDICKAIACALDAPREAVHDQAFNVGSTRNNLQIRDIAYRIQAQRPDCEVTFGQSDGDTRTYNVDFTKIEQHLPGFGRAEVSVDDAIAEFFDAFTRLQLDDAAFQSRLFTRLKQVQHLRDTGQVDERLYWAQQ